MATDDITTEGDFHERLREVVNNAVRNGVDIEGAWPVRNGDLNVPDWDIEIVALAGTGR